MPGDAFAPGELVQVYALVAYSGIPLQGLPVAFVFMGPPNSAKNVTLYRSASTNESGIASASVRISHLNMSTFGEWKVMGNTRIGDATVQDTLTFKVGWIVEIVSVTTLDENNLTQDSFARGRNVGVELTIRNIAMIEKVATLTVAMYDGLDVRIDSDMLNDFVVQPNEVPVFVYFLLYIPLSATIGDGTIYANAYTAPVEQGGTSYCPEVSKDFLIIERDVAVISVRPSTMFVNMGETIYVDIQVENLGIKVESFNVSAYANETLVDSTPVSNLNPLSIVEVVLIWNTSSASVGIYRISASASAVPEEFALSNNNLTDGFVQIANAKHDVAVFNVISSSLLVYVGDVLNIDVYVKNEGTYIESFNVTAFYDSIVIGTIQVSSLRLGEEKLIVFKWQTEDIDAGNYTLSALASQLTGEENTSNNQYVDGVVEVKIGPPPPPPVHDVAVTNVVPAASFVYVGDSVNVSVTVKNKGDQPESFSVFLYYNNTGNPAAPSILVANLPKDAEKTVIFRWSTRGLRSGNYTLIGYAEPVQDETSTLDNMYTDGVVKLASPIGGLFDFDWFWVYLILIFLLILLLLLTIFLLYRRRKKRKNQQAFVSGWRAWYYCRNLKQIHRNTAFLDPSCERR